MPDYPDWLQPSTYVYQKLFQTFVGVGGSVIDVSQFSSVTILVGNVDGTTPLTINYQFIDPVTGFIIDSGTLSCDSVANVPNWPSWTLPVIANNLKLFGPVGSPIPVVIGTNKGIPKRLNSDFAAVRTFSGTVPASSPIGTRVQMFGQDATTDSAIPQADLSHYNGQCFYAFNSSPVGITGNIEYGYLDAATVRNRVIHAQNPSTTVQKFLAGHPFAFTSWWFITTVVSPAQIVTPTITIMPATPTL